MASPGEATHPDDLLAQQIHRYGFTRISIGGSADPAGRGFMAVQAIGGDLTFGPGCTSYVGDAPSGGDVLPQGDVLEAPLSAVDVDGASAGAAYAFYDSSE